MEDRVKFWRNHVGVFFLTWTRQEHLSRVHKWCFCCASTNETTTTVSRLSIPTGTFTSVRTAPLRLSAAPLTPSGALTVPSRGWGCIFRGEGQECPWLCPHLLQPPLFSPKALCGASLCPPPLQLPRGAGDSPPLWRAEGAMTDSTDGAWKSPAKTFGSVEQQRAWESQGEIWLEKRQKESDGEKGDKERVRTRERGEGGEGCTCLRRVECEKWRFSGQVKSLLLFGAKNLPLWFFYSLL